MSTTGLHLNHAERAVAEQKILRSCHLLLSNQAAVHYSQGPDRWEGIHNHDRAYLGQYPKHGDCSSTATWVLWDATLRHRPADFVNGAGWGSGYTGTMLQHGRSVGRAPARIGQLVIYGTPGSTGEHVAVYIGGGFVMSHGGEAGPFKLRWNYRTDVQDVRDYL